MSDERATILWLDDDLLPLSKGITPQRSRLQPWLRWFHLNRNKFKLIEVYNLEGLKEHFRKDHFNRSTTIDARNKPSQYIDAILIDIMWRGGTGLSGNFEPLGFPNKNILPLDGGAQLLSLMLNEAHRERAPWLTCSSSWNIAVLTTLVSAAQTTSFYLDNNAQKRITVLEKEVVEDPANGLLSPSKNFIDWCNLIYNNSKGKS